MDYKQRGISDNLTMSAALSNDPLRNFSSDQSFADFDSSNICFGVGTDQFFPELAMSMDPPSLQSCQPNRDGKRGGQLDSAARVNSSIQLDWDPRAMLNNLSFLEQKIHNVQEVVRSIIVREGQFAIRPDELAAQQQLVTADLTGIIIQLISTTGNLLPSIKNTLLSTNPSVGQLGNIVSSPTSFGMSSSLQGNEVFPVEKMKLQDHDEQIKTLNDCTAEGTELVPIEDHDVKDCEDGGECENLPPGSYEVLQLEKEEILAPHTHFCLICGKGFKRDANLRMHMRGHGDEYKTPAALAKPSKESSSEPVLIKRYSCPFAGCKRNKEHKKFQPLKTILCVKNHYKRTHCDKRYTCSRCNSKKFSVIADLKTHEKHCGRDKWMCSCGTTFSRKDKLFGHVALFQGHTPALPMDENKGSGASDQVQNCESKDGIGKAGFSFGGNSSDDVEFLDVKGLDEDTSLFSSANFDLCNFGGFHEFPRPTFEVSDNSFPFMPAVISNYSRKNGENSSSDNLGR